jgi:histidine ammonia-lyase
LKALSLEPVRLGPKEGLALINGTQLSSATLSLALLRAKSLIEHANLACAMTLEGVRGSDAVFDQRIFIERNHPEASQMSEQIRGWLGTTSPIRESHKNCGKVQDPYSLRCAGQVHGAVWADYQNALRAVRNEINSSTDNPLLFAEEKLSLSGGNFHAMFVARASDSLAAGLSVLASISERRTALMMHQESSGHPFFLTRNGGLNSGFMMAQVSAAALVAEAKVLSHPASVDSIPTSADREDHVSMGPISGRKAMRVAELVEGVIAIELLCAAQAIDLLRPLKSSERIEEAHLRIRRDVAELQEDRVLSTDILKVQRLIQLSDLMEEPS